jgi:5'-3' exonuclease
MRCIDLDKERIIMLLIIDGNNIAYRAFHTPQGNLTTKQGEPTGVMYGFLNSLKSYLEKFPETTRCVVMWDGGKAEWRKKIYPEYKGNRSYGKDEEEKAKFDGLFKQINILHEFLPKLGINSVKIYGQEADDLVAIACRILSANNEQAIIVTSDKDMLQLVDENISIYTPYKDKVISLLNFYEETGVTKEAYIGYRALLGDPSDNIQGVPGIGEKTAKSLMDKYGHIDNILGAQGEAKKALMKSARTRRIFEPQNLRILGINNKIMNFKYVPHDPEVEKVVKEAIHGPMPTVSSKDVKEFFIRWQFVQNLVNYMTWIIPFKSLGSDY